MNDLVRVKKGGSVSLYERMSSAIEKCHSIDDCQNIANQATAIAAYHKQIKDDASMRKIIEIKLRAWRRLGELLTRVELPDGEGRYPRTIRDALQGDLAIAAISDDTIRQSLRIAALPDVFFNREVGDQKSSHSLLCAYERFERDEYMKTPAGRAELARREAEEKRREAYRDERRKEEAEREQRAQEETRQRIAAERAIVEAHREAMNEVGVTLERRDRERMREVVFLIKEPIHEALRQAAFDKRMTMQAILRSGLAMWFAAHGYDVPT
jgi:hypothetical protein